MTNYRLKLMCNSKIFSLKQSKDYPYTLAWQSINDKYVISDCTDEIKTVFENSYNESALKFSKTLYAHAKRNMIRGNI